MCNFKANFSPEVLAKMASFTVSFEESSRGKNRSDFVWLNILCQSLINYHFINKIAENASSRKSETQNWFSQRLNTVIGRNLCPTGTRHAHNGHNCKN